MGRWAEVNTELSYASNNVDVTGGGSSFAGKYGMSDGLFICLFVLKNVKSKKSNILHEESDTNCSLRLRRVSSR